MLSNLKKKFLLEFVNWLLDCNNNMPIIVRVRGTECGQSFDRQVGIRQAITDYLYEIKHK